MSRDAWLATHPYLQPLARLCDQVDRVATEVGTSGARVPRWDDHASDFGEGVPLLQSSGAAVDLEPAGKLIVALIDRLAASPPPGKVADELRELSAWLGGSAAGAEREGSILSGSLAAGLPREPGAPRRVVDWLLDEDALVPPAPGLLRFLGWSAMARYLAPVVKAFAGWRDDERWLRNYCPTCGSPPAMAHLVGVDPGRKRFLYCGRCHTRWQYGRTRCPFCENDTQRLAVVAIEGEAGLRIDYCESCRGYLKSYAGLGDEGLMLSDWSSLHIDLVARDRGLKRRAASLYDLQSPAT